MYVIYIYYINYTIKLFLYNCVTCYFFPDGAVVKSSPPNIGAAGNTGSIPGLGKSSGGGNGNPLQYSCLENPRDGRAQSVAELCQTLCGPIDCSPPGSTVHRIIQARILDWVAMPSSRGSSQPRDQTCASRISCIIGGFFTHQTTWEAHLSNLCSLIL